MEGQTHLRDILPLEPVSPPPEGARDLTVPLSGGTLPVRVFPASEEAPLLVFFHAEGERIDRYDRLGELFRERDVSLAVVGYRGANGGEGEPGFETLFHDAGQALAHLERELGARGPLALLGRSLGAGVALRVAVTFADRVKALILDSPMVDGRRWLARRGLPAEHDPFEVQDLVAQWRKPLLIFHAQLDGEVTLTEMERLLIFAGGHGKRLLIMPGYRREETVERGGGLYAETVAEMLNRLANRFGRRWKHEP